MSTTKVQSSLYDALNLHSTCSKEEIHEAWRNIQSTTPKQSTVYVNALKAYQVLSDAEKRVMYNTFGTDDAEFSQLNSEMYFSKEFRNNPSVAKYDHQKWSKSEKDVKRDLVVSLEDLYNGKQIIVNEKRTRPCSACEGSSVLPCQHCINTPNINPQCAACKGRRYVERPQCTRCQGKKQIMEEDTATVTVHKGMKNGDVIKVPMMGKYWNSRVAANLLLTLKQLPHDEYLRFGDNLYVTETVNLSEALCGYRKVFTHLDGRKILVSSGGAVLYPGRKMMIRGEGMPINDMDRGDLIVLFKVRFPDNLQSLGEEAMKEMEKHLPAKPEPTPHEHDVLRLTDYDPKLKFHKRQRVYDDEKPNIKLPTSSKERCMQQ